MIKPIHRSRVFRGVKSCGEPNSKSSMVPFQFRIHSLFALFRFEKPWSGHKQVLAEP